MSCSWIPRRLSCSSRSLICVKSTWKSRHINKIPDIYHKRTSRKSRLNFAQNTVISNSHHYFLCHLRTPSFTHFSLKRIIFNMMLCLLKLQENKRMPREGSLLCAILPPSQRKCYPEYVSCFLGPVRNKIH